MATSGIVGRTQGGTGFQLFTQTADNMSAIYTGFDLTAAEAARDAYFGSNPDDLATLDANQFLIIKLVITGTDPDTAIYQQRQNNAWVDVTSLVQGEQGEPGTPGGDFTIVEVTAPYTVLTTDDYVIVTGPGTVTLPSSVGVVRAPVIKSVLGGGTITVVPDGAETINGLTSTTITPDATRQFTPVSGGWLFT